MSYSDLSIKGLLLLTNVKTACYSRNDPHISRNELWAYGNEAAAELLSCGFVAVADDNLFILSPAYWEMVRPEKSIRETVPR